MCLGQGTAMDPEDEDAQRDKSRHWWVLFRMIGLEITDPDAGLAEPCFPDATLFSRDAVDEVIATLKLNESGPPGNDNERDALFMVKRFIRDAPFESFLAIRRTSTGDLDDDEARDLRFSGGSARANEIASVLSLVLLAHSKTASTCALADRLQIAFVSIVAVETNGGGYSQTVSTAGSGHYIGRDQKRLLRLSRQEVSSFLRHPELEALVEMLLIRSESTASSIRRAVLGACLRLSESLHASSVASRVLGAVTALEMMVLTEANTDYGTIQARVGALIGTAEADRFRLPEILRARHRYVHRGEEPEDKTLSHSAIGLALLSLLRLATLSRGFQRRDSIVEYLDFLGRLPAVESHLPDSDRAIVAALNRHRPGPSALPFYEALSRAPAAAKKTAGTPSN